MNKVFLYTDGSYDDSLDIGSWASIILFPDGTSKEFSGEDNEKICSSQIAELFAIVEGLRYLSCFNENVVVYSDCLSLIDYINNALLDRDKNKYWEYKIFRQCQSLFKCLKKILHCSSLNSVKFEHVKGHNGDYWNERCHDLSAKLLKQARIRILGKKRYKIIFND